MNRFIAPTPLFFNNGIGLIRIIVGLFMIYHGWELFDHDKMTGYLNWDMFKNSSAGKFLAYAGKAAEFIGGIFLLLGWFTRIACIVLIGTMIYIAFFIGNGKVWYEDQHPFLFVLLGFVFIFTGPGNFSLDKLVFNKNS